MTDRHSGSHWQKAETIGSREWLYEQIDRTQGNPVSLATAGRVFPNIVRVEVLACPTSPLQVAHYNIHDGLDIPEYWPLELAQTQLLLPAMGKVAEGFCYTTYGITFEYHPGTVGGGPDANAITIYDSFGIDDNFADSIPGYHFEDYSLTGAAAGYIQKVMGDGLTVQQAERLFVGQFAGNEEIIRALADRHGKVLLRDVIPTSYHGIHRQSIAVRGKDYE